MNRAYLPGLLLILGLLFLFGPAIAPAAGNQSQPAARPPAAGNTGTIANAPAETLEDGGPTPTPTQCSSSGCFAVSAGAAIISGTTMVAGTQCDDCYAQITFPFAVTIGSRTYVTASVVSNGHLDFDAPDDDFTNVCLPISTLNTAIFPHWDDLDLRVAYCGADCGIYTAVLGTAPNRTFVVEWRAALYATRLKPVNFEIIFFEGQANRFDIVYGQVTLAGNGATVGFQNGAFSCMFECNTGGLSEGLRLSFPPPLCATPTVSPTASSSTPIGTSTATRTRTATYTATQAATFTRSATPQPTSTPCPGCATATVTRTPAVTNTSTATPTPCPMNFSDVTSGDWFYEYVRCLYCRGAISGYADGTFRPYNNTTRGQMTKIVVLAFAYPIYTPTQPTFNDVPTTDPFYSYIETAAFNQIVSGYSDGSFRPYNNVTRGQLSKIVVVAAQWALINPTTPAFSDVPVEHPFYTYVETAYCHQIITGYADGTFRPANNATRAQISKIVCEAVRNTSSCVP